MTRKRHTEEQIIAVLEDAHAVKQYVAGLHETPEAHYLPGYALDLNPDELVWSHVKRRAILGVCCKQARRSMST